jgi:hypothetical protein
MLEGNTRTFGDHGQGQAGTSVDHRADILVHLLRVDEAPSEVFVVVASLEAPMAEAAFTEGGTAKRNESKQV